MMHAKTFVVDGVFSMFGSANFDNRSLELNDELNVAVVEPRSRRALRSGPGRGPSAPKELDLEEWRQRSMLEKTREHFWSYFGEIF